MKINCLNLAGGFRSQVAACALFWLGSLALPSAFAASDQEAHVTRIIKDVNVLGANKAARPAILNDHVGPGTGVRTGADSRAELTFSDLSITRLGENTVFSFNGAGRTVQLGSGAVLVEAPPNSAAIHVNTAAFSAAVSGGTALIEFHLGGISKILILEGQGDITPNGGVVFILPAGEMVTMTPDGKFSEPQKVDIQKIMSTSHLITEFGTLPNEELIYEVIQQQGAGGNNPNSQPPHDTTLDDTVGRDDANPPGGTPGSTPGGGGGGGSIPVITSPDPYVINSGTTITTDPTITTNGQTNQGAIYHGSAVDGPLSAFIFGSTSGFDAVSGFDTQVQGTMEAAGFKFKDLQITGNPTIDTTNGPISLGLIALGNITTGSPGGLIDFSGLRGVLLAAQNGSVTLGPEVSFSIAHDFNAYARGDNGDLTLGSNVTAGEHVNLFAQRDMSISSTVSTEQFYSFTGRNMTITGTDTIQAPTITISSLGNISWDGETSDATPTSSDGSVTIQAVGDLNVANDLSFTRHSVGSDGLNLTVLGGGAVTIQGNLTLVVDNSSGGGSIGTGGNIDLEAGGNLTVNGSSGITLNVLNNNGGDITDGGNVSINVGGNLTAPTLSAVINNQDGGHIHGNAILSVGITGNAGFSAGGLFDIENNSFNTLQGGILDGDAVIDFSAANVSSGTGSLNWNILNQSNGDGAGGQIGAAATITINAANLASASTDRGDISALINNQGGSIANSAAINLTATGAVGSTFAGNVNFSILNNDFGAVGGDASITAQMASLGAGNSLTFQISNNFGAINGDATVAVTVTGAGGVNLPNQATFAIDNTAFFSDQPHEAVPGGLGGSASVTLDVQQGGLMDDDGLEVRVDNTYNFTGIGGSATVSANIAGALQINAGDANFEILNSYGFIGGSAAVTASAGSITANNVLAQIDNSDGTISGGASISVHVTGDLTSRDAATFEVLNNSGSINNNPSIDVHAGSFNVGTNLLVDIDNETGSIDDGGNGGPVTLTSDGAITVGGTMSVYGQVTAGGDINVGTMASTDVTTTGNIIVGSGGITRFRFVDGLNTAPDVPHTLTGAHITSTGGINFNGDDSDGTNIPGNGGTLTLNTDTVTFDPAGDIQGSVTLNGGAAAGGSPAGDGGHLTVNASGDITANSDIEATTGYQDANGEPSGNGGSVTLHSTGGLVTVNGTITVSSDDPTPSQTPPPPIRRSATGGNITLQSDLTTGQGITVGANAQLLSLLDSTAPGPGGSITLSTMGADITVSPGATIEADRGNITIDQNDPAGTPVITIDGPTLTSDTLTINGAGDVNIGQTTATTLNFSSATLNASNNVNWNVANTTILSSLTSLNITAGNELNLTGGESGKPVTLALNLTADSTLTAGAGGINAPFVDFTNSGANLNFISAGSITADSITHPGSASGTIAANGGSLSLTTDLVSGAVSALTNISVGGNVTVGSLTATNGTITVGGSMGVFGAISAGGDITAGTVEVSQSGITTPGNVIAGSGGIHPFIVEPGGAAEQNFITANTIVSPNGMDFSGNQFGGIDGLASGGKLTVNASTLTIDSSTGVGAANFSGADAGATDFNGNVFTTVGGDGGTFIVNATGDITANNGTDITATTGNNASGDNGFSGAGGNVTLASTGGTVTVADTIQVSSDDPTPGQTPPPPIRRSNSGGNITLTSGKASGTAIQVTSTAQLLSLLDSAATGPGGVITVKATGASSAVSVSGTVTADKGTIDIEQTGTNGTVTLGDPPSLMGPNGPDGFAPPALTMSADIIKAGALGDNGVLTIGNANLNANTLIALYGGASNGTVDFVANVTLSGATTKIIAANTVTIDNGVTVTILGAAADVYTNNAHYDSAHGGDGTGGSFDGGVNTHLNQAPPPFGQTSNIAQNNPASPSSPNNRTGSTNSRTTTTASTSSTQSNRTAPVAQPGRPTFLH